MTRIDHYRLDVRVQNVDQTLRYDNHSVAMGAFRRYAQRRDVQSAELTAHEADGEYIKRVAVCDNVRPDDDRAAQALGWPERY